MHASSQPTTSPLSSWAKVQAEDFFEASAEKYFKRWMEDRKPTTLALAITYMQHIVDLHERK